MAWNSYLCLGIEKSYIRLGLGRSYADMLTGCDSARMVSSIRIVRSSYRRRREIAYTLISS